MSPTPARIAAAAAIATVTSACAAQDSGQRYSRAQVQKSLDTLETPGLRVGEFTLAQEAVLDGDTIRVRGLETSLRLLAIDTEETFKKDKNIRAAEEDFDAYLRARRGDSDRPIKTGTPMGEKAREFAEDFFDGAGKVRLERDHPKEIRGAYDRYLVYVLARKGGEWVNYNVESVRAGMSPYFTKYGYSRRFHDAFVAAEEAARQAERGIWSPDTQNYGDYGERKAWWDARADFIREFEKQAKSRDDHIMLTNWDSLRRIGNRVGEEVTVLGSVGNIILGDEGPTRVYLSRKRHNDFPIIFFDKDVFLSSGIQRYEGEFVTVRGFVNEYADKREKRTELQIVVNSPTQVTGSNVPGIESVQSTAMGTRP